jgi:arsenate reductase-like glutaredoxin family protein
MSSEAWATIAIAVGVNLAFLIFTAGGAWVKLNSLQKSVTKQWQRVDAMHASQERRYRRTLVVLTQLAQATNPHGDAVLKTILEMSDDNGAGAGDGGT